MSNWKFVLATAVVVIACGAARAQHLDVKVSTSNGPVVGSKIEIGVFGDLTLFLGATGTLPIHHETGYRIFPTWFSERTRQGVSTTSTDNPGFHAFPSSFASLEEIQFRALDVLLTWTSGTQSWSAGPAGTWIRLSGGIPDQIALDRFFNPTPAVIAAYDFYAGGTRFSGDMISGPVVAPIGIVGRTGGFHDHWDWFLEGDGRQTPAAHLVQVQIISSAQAGGANKYVDSDPFYVLFSNRLTTSEFNGALLSLTTAPVPEPATWGMLLAGLIVLAGSTRLTRRRS